MQCLVKVTTGNGKQVSDTGRIGSLAPQNRKPKRQSKDNETFVLYPENIQAKLNNSTPKFTEVSLLNSLWIL